MSAEAAMVRAFRAGHPRVRSGPGLLYVELTERCESRCIMCFQADRPANAAAGDMPLENAIRLADSLFDQAAVVDLRGFGETGLYPWLADLLDHLRARHPGPAYKLITNGQSLGPDVLERLHGLGTHLRISFDGADAATYHAIRRGSSHARALECLRGWNAIAPRDRRAWLLVTVQRDNLRSLLDLVCFACAEGAPGMCLVPVVAAPGDAYAVGPREADEAIAEAATAGAAAGLEMVFHRRLLPRVSLPSGSVVVQADRCSAPWTSLLVKHDGRLHPCSHHPLVVGRLGPGPVSVAGLETASLLALRADLAVRRPTGVCAGCDRNELAYASPDGEVHDPTWRYLMAVHSPED
jgi:MoaA/NifB/PqqE/SkfB family radical SAM enzyme